MSYFRTCSICGANLDPGETCDCIKIPPTELEPPRAASMAKAITQINYIMKGAGCQCQEVRPAL